MGEGGSGGGLVGGCFLQSLTCRLCLPLIRCLSSSDVASLSVVNESVSFWVIHAGACSGLVRYVMSLLISRGELLLTR